MLKRLKNNLKSLLLALEYEYSRSNHKESPSAFFLLLENPFRVLKAIAGRDLYISHIDVVITTVCTLKCYGCGALMDHYKHPGHVELDAVISSLECILSTVRYINRVHILGGEPLCYPHLFEVLEFLSKNDKVKEVVINTNGTLLFKDQKVLDLMHKPKYIVEISDYGTFHAKKVGALIRQLEENHIRYKRNEMLSTWVDFGGFDKRGRSDKELRKIFSECPFKWSASVLNGRLYRCTRSAHGSNLKLFPVTANESVLLTPNNGQLNKLKRKLFRFVYGNIPYLSCCDYCDMIKDPKYIKAGVQRN